MIAVNETPAVDPPESNQTDPENPEIPTANTETATPVKPKRKRSSKAESNGENAAPKKKKERTVTKRPGAGIPARYKNMAMDKLRTLLETLQRRDNKLQAQLKRNTVFLTRIKDAYDYKLSSGADNEAQGDQEITDEDIKAAME